MKVFLLIVVAAVCGDAIKVSPVGKVVQLLDEMKVKVNNEGKEAKKLFEEHMEDCRSNIQELEHNIERNKDKVEEYTSVLTKAKSEVESGTSEITELAQKVAKDSEDLDEAKKMREEQLAEFSKKQMDLEESINTLVRAIAVLRKAGLGFPQLKEALTQVTMSLSTVMDAAFIDMADKSKLQSLLQKDDDDKDDDDEGAKFENPKAAAYTSHAKNIVEMIADLKVKAENELHEMQTTEMKRQNEFQLLQQSLSDSINTANRDRKNNVHEVAMNKEIGGKAEGDLATEHGDLSTNEKTLGSTKSECEERKTDYEDEVKSRGEEVAAIGKAVEILTNKAAAASIQSRSFVQMSDDDDLRQRAVDVLRQAARRFRSVQLAQLAMRANEDPFGKVKGMIREMIDRLHKQSAQEENHHAYCVSEQKDNVKKRDDVQSKFDNFSTRLEKAKSAEAQLKEDIANLAEEVAESDVAMLKATKLRQEESAAYVKASSEFKTGLTALQSAIQVLREYYSASGDHDKKEQGGNVIISMLETAEQDMSNKEAKSELDESNSQKSFEKMKQDQAVSKASKEASKKAKEGELARLGDQISDLNSDVDGSKNELDAVLAYLDKLKKACTHKPQTFAERQAAQQKEIESLHEALDILNKESAGSEAGFLQRK